MKPIALTPGQLDAALDLPEAGCNGCGWHATFVSDADALSASYAHRCPVAVSGGSARAGKTAAMPPTVTRHRLECTCAGGDYGMCPACAP